MATSKAKTAKKSETAKKSKTPRKAAKRQAGKSKKKTPNKWSTKVMQRSNALDLESRIFKSKDPRKVARSLKRSSEKSKRRKGTPLQSAMSMLNFYMNRAGKSLPAGQKKVLDKAKNELRQLFGRPPQ